MTGFQGYQPIDAYKQYLMLQMMRGAGQQQQKEQPQSSTIPSAGVGASIKELIDAITGSSGATEAVSGGMSSVPAMTIADIQSLSTGGSGLQSMAPEIMQSVQAPEAASSGLGLTGYELPAIIAAQQGYIGFKSGRNYSNPMNAMGKQLRSPASWIVPTRVIGAGLGSALAHKTTRDLTKENTKGLQETDPQDATWQNYVSGMRKQYELAPPDPSKPFAGKYATWDEYKKAGLEASDLTGVYGNMSTFGPEWSKYSQQQREAVTKGLIDNNLYDSKKGDVVVTDANKAKAIRDEILAKMNQPIVSRNATNIYRK